MNIIDLVEYTRERREIFKKAIQLDVDVQAICDLEIADMVAAIIIELQKFSITNVTADELSKYSYTEVVDKYYQTLRNNERYLIRGPKQRNDMTQLLGYEPDWDKYTEERYDYGISDDYLDYFTYTIESGKRDLLVPRTEQGYGIKNSLIVMLNYLQCEELNKILTHPNQDSRIYTLSFEEFKYSGRVDIALDETYSLDERDEFVSTYKQIGIDLRIVPNNKIKPEEQHVYRELSNKFRHERNRFRKGLVK